jgi:hypothetical protein
MVPVDELRRTRGRAISPSAWNVLSRNFALTEF